MPALRLSRTAAFGTPPRKSSALTCDPMQSGNQQHLTGTILDDEIPRARVAILLNHFSELGDDRDPWPAVAAVGKGWCQTVHCGNRRGESFCSDHPVSMRSIHWKVRPQIAGLWPDHLVIQHAMRMNHDSRLC